MLALASTRHVSEEPCPQCVVALRGVGALRGGKNVDSVSNTCTTAP